MPFTGAPHLSAPPGAWAQWYAAQGWPVFPCLGKAPAGRLAPHGLKDATTDLATIHHWWRQWPTMNIGTPTGLTWWALDIDARHDGPETLRDLEHSYSPLPRTVTSLTGSGGGSQHQLWAMGGRPLVNKAQLGNGLDVQGPGSYIILPPSIHPDTGQPYVWEADFGPDDLEPQPMPAWLEALVSAPATAQHTLTTPGTPSGGAILEGSRETTLMALAGAMRRVGATAEEIVAALEVVNQRCIPPLEQKDLARMAHSVERYAPAPTLVVGAPPVGWSVNGVSSQTSVHGVSPGWRAELFAKKNGELYANEFNISSILQYSDHWHKPENTLWYDVLLGRHMIDQEQITRTMLVKIAHWFGGSERMPMTSLTLLEDCLHTRCEENKRDRIMLWLNNLPPWDGTPRLDTWLITTAQAEDDPTGYTRHISRRFILSMIARGLHPGCQYREVVVLEGPENIGKSHIVETLASKEFCIVLSMNLEAKEAHMMLQRAWLAELADLDAMNRTEETRLKAFITMEEDTYVPKYRNESISVPRRAIFVGTTNDRNYLKSLSGNTRFLPLWLPGPIDLEALHTMREQLFAEALHVFHASGAGWWHMPLAIQGEALRLREGRRVKNPYEIPLRNWLGQRTETTWAEIAEHFLMLKTPEAWKDRSLQMQIGSALRAIGFETTDEWRPGLNGGKGGKWHGWTIIPF